MKVAFVISSPTISSENGMSTIVKFAELEGTITKDFIKDCIHDTFIQNSIDPNNDKYKVSYTYANQTGVDTVLPESPLQLSMIMEKTIRGEVAKPIYITLDMAKDGSGS